MKHYLKYHVKVNLIRITVIIVFIALFGFQSIKQFFSTLDSFNIFNIQDQQEMQQNLTNRNKKVYDWKLNSIIKTTTDIPAYSQINTSRTLGLIPKGENLLIVSTEDQGRWVEVKHGINRLWVEGESLK